MKKEAVLHVPLSQFAYAYDERTIVLRLRAAKGDLKSCKVFYGDRVDPKPQIETFEKRWFVRQKMICMIILKLLFMTDTAGCAIISCSGMENRNSIIMSAIQPGYPGEPDRIFPVSLYKKRGYVSYSVMGERYGDVSYFPG